MELSASSTKTQYGIASFTSRDLILYSLGIGCSTNKESNDDTNANYDECKYLYEHHDNFASFPLFPLTLIFRALPLPLLGNNNKVDTQQHLLLAKDELLDTYFHNNHQQHNSQMKMNEIKSCLFGMPTFPPPMMQTSFDSAEGLVIHVGQKFRLHCSIPTKSFNAKNANNSSIIEPLVPITTLLLSKVLSIQRKSKGILLITETEYYISPEMNNKKTPILLATSQAITLITNSSNTTEKSNKQQQQQQQPKQKSSKKIQSSLNPPIITKRRTSPNKNPNHACSYTYEIKDTQALLYRLSGDTNAIHVIPPPNVFNNNNPKEKRPIIHGLCTLGYAVRSVLSYCHTNKTGIGGNGWEMTYVECNFRKPIYIGDSINVVIWDENNDSALKEKQLLHFEVHSFSSSVNDNNTTNVAIQDGLVEVKLISSLSTASTSNSYMKRSSKL